MKRISKWLCENSLFIHYITGIIFLMGWLSFCNIQRELRPNVNFNRVAVTAVYPGASPKDIEELVIDPLEEKLSEVDGIYKYRSVSFSGKGFVSIEIDENYPDSSEVVDEIRRKISEVKDFPESMDDPRIREIKAVNNPVMGLALFGDLDPLDLKLEVEKLKDFIRFQPGVQSVEDSEFEDLQIKILAHPDKLDANDITLLEIVSQIKVWSRQRSGGLFETPYETTSVRVGEDYNDLEKFKSFVVRSNDSGRSIQLKDVAHISYSLEKSQRKTLFESLPAVLLTVVKKPSADIIETIDQLHLSLETYKQEIPSQLSLKVYEDESVRVKNRLRAVSFNAIFGLILVIFILSLLLDRRSALVTSIGVPIAIMGGLTLIFLLGNTLNSLVILGLIIVLGMLVDDAVVICENIYFHLERGLSSKDAAIKGVSEISGPVIATVLTTVFAFFPILFMKGIMGQFLRVIPQVVIAMLLISLFEALCILPVHAKDIMKPVIKNKSNFFKKFEDMYRRYLYWGLKSRHLVLLGFILFFCVSLFQGYRLFKKFNLFPARGLSSLSVRLELEKNTPIDKSVKMAGLLAKDIRSVDPSSFESIHTKVGEIVTGGSRGSRQLGSHLALLSAIFISENDFYRKESQIIDEIRKRVQIFGEKYGIKTSVSIDRPGPPIGRPIHYEIVARDFNKGFEVAKALKDEFSKINGVRSLETDSDRGVSTYRLEIDNDLAVAEGIDPIKLSTTVFTSTTGQVVSEILKNNEKIEILVGISSEYSLIKKSSENHILKNISASDHKFSLDRILNLKVKSRHGEPVPIKTFIKKVVEKSPSSIQRSDGLRTVTLFGDIDDKVISGGEANSKVQKFIQDLKSKYPGIKIRAGGGEKQRIETLKDTGRLYILALILIFMVISLVFQSFLYPFLVLLTIPMGLCGVVWALTLHGVSFSLMGMVGMIGLSGVVVNTSILLLSFVQQGLKRGMSVEDAIIEAGVRRLRPITITSITTLIGLAPAVYGVGGIDFMIQPLALVLAWGLFVSTVMTLLGLLPIIYYIKL